MFLFVFYEILMYCEVVEVVDVIVVQFVCNQVVVEMLVVSLCVVLLLFVVICVWGSLDYVVIYVKYLLEIWFGLVIVLVLLLVGLVYEVLLQLCGVLYIVILQFGRSFDLLCNVEVVWVVGVCVVVLVNVEDLLLVQLVEIVIVFGVGVECSVVVIKSYFVLLLVILQLVVYWSQDVVLIVVLWVLFDVFCQVWNSDWLLFIEGLVLVYNLFVFGCGFGFGVVQEVVLKFKEICGLYVEVYSLAEVKYGLMVLVGLGFLVLVFVQFDEIGVGICVVVEEFVVCDVQVWLVVVGGDLVLLVVLYLVCVLLLVVQVFYCVINVLVLCCGYNFDLLLYLNKVMEIV